MAASEIFARDAASGGSVSYSHHNVQLSSAEAPWRDLIRLERCHKALERTEVSLLWSGFGLVRSEGALDYRFDGQPMRATRMLAGDLFVYPQGETVYVNMPHPVELTCIQLAPAVLAAVAEEAGCTAQVAAGGSLRDDDVATLASLLEGEVRSGCEGGRFYGEHLAYALAAKLIQRFGAVDDARADRRMHGRKLAAVLDYIHVHAAEDLSLEDLARVAQLSPFHFSRLFKGSTGLAPHQYVLQWRVEEAKRLLRHSRMEIVEIAYRLGFRDQSHFTARFRKITGATPKRWRASA